MKNYNKMMCRRFVASDIALVACEHNSDSNFISCPNLIWKTNKYFVNIISSRQVCNMKTEEILIKRPSE